MGTNSKPWIPHLTGVAPVDIWAPHPTGAAPVEHLVERSPHLTGAAQPASYALPRSPSYGEQLVAADAGAWKRARRRIHLKDQDPAPPPSFPSYVQACWVCTQLRFNFIGKGGKVARLRLLKTKNKNLRNKWQQCNRIKSFSSSGLKLQSCVKLVARFRRV